MKILIVGGSGDVGTLVMPHLAQNHTLRVFDLRPPLDARCEYIEGDVTDAEALERAAQGMDALLYMAMGHKGFDTLKGITTNFDVNIKGVYLALRAAHLAGIVHAVYTSTLSVYNDLGKRYIANEDMPPDAHHFYGLTKRLGEEICRSAVGEWGLSINALRLCLPVSDEQWRATYDPDVQNCSTTASDLARAYEAALNYRSGFQAFTISGDYQQKMMDMTKARTVLGWEPLARPQPKTPA